MGSFFSLFFSKTNNNILHGGMQAGMKTIGRSQAKNQTFFCLFFNFFEGYGKAHGMMVCGSWWCTGEEEAGPSKLLYSLVSICLSELVETLR